MNFGIKLQTLRKEKRMSQEALAQQLGVSRQAVSKWETGEGYPETDTIIMISNLFGVTLDHLMKDGDTEHPNISIDEDSIVLSTVELEDFITFKKKFALIIASAVASIIIAVSFTVFYDNNLAIGAMMLVVALAVGSMIIIEILSSKYEYLEKKHIILKTVDIEAMKEKQKKHNTIFAIMIATGVFLIIGSVALVAIFEEYPMVSGYFLWIVALSVFMFIYTGILHGMYHQICNNKEFVKEMKKEEEAEQIYSITMPLAAMGYLVLGFVFNLWHPGWLIFPITAIASFAFMELRK